MPKLINQNFLTLPQQVGKNKKDIESLEYSVRTVQTELNKLVIGDLVIQILNPNNPIIIKRYGSNTLPSSVQTALLEYIRNYNVLIGKKETLYVNIKIEGGFVPNVNSEADYAVLFTTTTIEPLDKNSGEYLFRAVGYSSDIKFEIYAEYTNLSGEITFSVAPDIILISTLSNSVYYTKPNYIVGGVVNKNELIPQATLTPPQIGDMVIAGSGIYTIKSITGTSVFLNTHSGFVAPEGALKFMSLNTTSNTLSNEDKIKINNITGVKIFNVDGINGLSMEEQITALGLEFRFGSYISYSAIGSETNPMYVSNIYGCMAIGFVNTTGDSVTLTDLRPVAYINPNRTSGAYTQTANLKNTSYNPILLAYDATTLSVQLRLQNMFINYNSTVINNNMQFGILIKF